MIRIFLPHETIQTSVYATIGLLKLLYELEGDGSWQKLRSNWSGLWHGKPAAVFLAKQRRVWWRKAEAGL